MENNLESRKIELEQDTLIFLNTTRKWSMFLAILGFIMLGIILIIGLITGTFLSAFSSTDSVTGVPDTLILALFLFTGLVNFFPVYFLFQFSRHTATAVQNLDKHEMRKAFRNLKFHYICTGIIVILILVIYVIVLVATGTSMRLLNGF
jgi:hypothetical protein